MHDFRKEGSSETGTSGLLFRDDEILWKTVCVTVVARRPSRCGRNNPVPAAVFRLIECSVGTLQQSLRRISAGVER